MSNQPDGETTMCQGFASRLHHSKVISIGNYTVREVLMKNRTRVWRNVCNTASA